MLWCVYGGVGACKTLLGGMADALLPAVRAHRHIFTNITGVEYKIAGIVAYTKIPATDIHITKLTSDKQKILTEILAICDDKANRGCLLILDEVKELFLANKMFNDWLELRMNYMRKDKIDFVLIAQNPSYIDSGIKFLADGSSFFIRLYKFGVKSYTKELLYNCGDPYLDAKGRPYREDGSRIRKVDPDIFKCYVTGRDDATSDEEESHKQASFWKSPTAKYFYIAIFVFVVILASAIFTIWKFTSIARSFSDLTPKNTSKKSSVVLSSSSSRLLSSDDELQSDSVTYTSYVFDDGYVLKTDMGEFRNYEKVSRNCYLVDSRRTICYSSSQGVQGDR